MNIITIFSKNRTRECLWFFFLVVVVASEHAPVDSGIFRIRFDGLRVNCSSFEVIFFLEERIALLPQRRRHDRCCSCLHRSHSNKAHEKNETRQQRGAKHSLQLTSCTNHIMGNRILVDELFPHAIATLWYQIHALVDELTSFWNRPTGLTTLWGTESCPRGWMFSSK